MLAWALTRDLSLESCVDEVLNFSVLDSWF